jgi:hypothetical protein
MLRCVTNHRFPDNRTQILPLLDFIQRMQGVSRTLTDRAFRSGNPRLRMDDI